ncbi:MAG: hypothetical protein I3274_02715 [Candidatus Moeniiplasma glomeromycotorum]|nr:hypothetical protein [Candidatus Moeniiplasma glomeromycotorum]MCE8167517.1 hypothetical protein [Candidatus Moeniiplasma glomeromycotorum]
MPAINEHAKKNNLNQQTSLNYLPAQERSQLEQKPSGLVNTLGSLLPLAPLLFEQWTGQKIPPMTGTLAEMQSNLSSLALNVQQVLQNQQQLYQTLQALQNSAQSSLSQLTSQVSQIQSLRLTHSRERKEIEYNPGSKEEEY